MTKEELNKIEKETKELLSSLEIPAKAQINFNEKNNCVDVQIDSDEAALLIGFHGETIQAIQVILSFLVHKSLGNWLKVMVNVGDYRERRQESLARMAVSVAQEAKLSGQPQTLPPMSAFDRRLIHLALAADPAVETLSEGEGKDRHVVVKTKQPSS